MAEEAVALEVLGRWLELAGEGRGEDELDAAIGAGERALRASPDTGDLLHRLLAIAYQERWNRDREDFTDAERAIELWRRQPEDGFVAFLCGALVAHRAERTHDAGDMAEAVRLGELAAETLDDGESWYLAGWAHFVRGEFEDALKCLETAGERDPDDDLTARLARDQLRAASVLREQGRLDQERLAALVARAHAVLEIPGSASPASQALLAGTVAMVEIGAATREGRAHDFARIRALIERYEKVDLPDPHLRAELDAARSQLAHFTQDDLDRGVTAAERLAASDRFSPEQRAAISEHLTAMRASRAADRGDLRALDEALAEMPVEGIEAEMGPAAAAARLAALWSAAERDLPRIAEEAAELLERIPDDYRMLKIASGLIAGSIELELRRDDRASGYLAAACDLAGGPHHALWPSLAVAYGQSLRASEKEKSRRLGLSAVRALVWQALLQADTSWALQSASGAAKIVRTVAGWCAEDRAHEDLIAALDTGRGLALHAASASRSMPSRLAAHPDLAEEWRSAGGVGEDLRVRALHALTTGSDLFATVSSGEIQSALTDVRADALVYLVPGLAVVVPVAGRVSVRELPDLQEGRVPDGWADAGRDLGEATAKGDDFDEVCRWAWSACMGPLAELTERWQLHRPARLVLVPTGGLSLIPWHAATYDDASGRHYAIERLVISYGVSARMFCGSARHPLRAPESALIVGDPRGDLRHAAAEARDVRQDFYPDGTLLTEATVGDVLGWIDERGRGPSLLHLACHGQIDPTRPADARLLLADGDLPVLRLLERSRSAGLNLDRVVLSACSTGASGSLRDEAVSLATAFLAGGAHTVFGSLWVVPDAETAKLMYALHRHLSIDGLAPADALRHAQLAMLGEKGWAAFVHYGR